MTTNIIITTTNIMTRSMTNAAITAASTHV